jgi:hypothetical protein
MLFVPFHANTVSSCCFSKLQVLTEHFKHVCDVCTVDPIGVYAQSLDHILYLMYPSGRYLWRNR